MCDTFVVLPEYTSDGTIIFGKNSDREANEAHYVEIIPAMTHAAGAVVECTYVAIPQVAKTNRMLLCRPVWIWGAEMGINEHGVVIGNEAVFSKVKANSEPGLIGMDFLRLALERGNTALEALHVITNLLETYGQSGDCGFSHPFFYHNSFLIADRNEAWKLETVDRQWAASKLNGYGTISNCLTIGKEWDLASADLVSFADKKGYTKKHVQFNFSDVYSDWLYTRFSNAQNRKNCTGDQIKVRRGQFQLRDAFSILRSHHGDEQDFSPSKATLGSDVCMHAGFGPIRVSQTTGSMVARISKDSQDIWVTASSAPCLSLFKPLKLSQDDLFDFVPGKEFERDSYWWKHEDFHRRFLLDYRTWIGEYSAERDQIEEKFMNLFHQDVHPELAIQIWEDVKSQSETFLSKWSAKLAPTRVSVKNPLYLNAWNKMNREAKITL